MGLSCSRSGVTPALDPATAKEVEEAEARLAELTPAEVERLTSKDELMATVQEVWAAVKEKPALSKDPTVTALLKAARQASAEEYFALSEEEQRTMQFQEEDADGRPYYASLNAALTDGSTALLRADFLERLSAKGRPLGHRAELSPEAFYEGPIWRGVTIMALSYMWGSPDHPDPKGSQLRDVARFLRWLQRSNGPHEGKLVVVMWDWASLYQDKPFFDPRRTDEQTRMFKAGLKNVNLWYCHPLTLTLMNRKTPKGRENGYDASGWPIFERGVSYFIKSHEGVIDLHPLLKMLVDKGYDEKKEYQRSIWDDFNEDPEEDDDTPLQGDNLCDFDRVASAVGALAQAAPPLAPAAMSAKLKASTFTNGADKKFVIGKYEETFMAVLGKVKTLNFSFMRWVTKKEWSGFCLKVLPLCASLEYLNLEGNRNMKVDIVELVAKLPPTLIDLNLEGCKGCFGNAGKADWGRLPALWEVNLDSTKVTGTEEEIRDAGCTAEMIDVDI